MVRKSKILLKKWNTRVALSSFLFRSNSRLTTSTTSYLHHLLMSAQTKTRSQRRLSNYVLMKKDLKADMRTWSMVLMYEISQGVDSQPNPSNKFFQRLKNQSSHLECVHRLPGRLLSHIRPTCQTFGEQMQKYEDEDLNFLAKLSDMSQEQTVRLCSNLPLQESGAKLERKIALFVAVDRRAARET